MFQVVELGLSTMFQVMPSSMFLVSPRMMTGLPSSVQIPPKLCMSVLSILAPTKDWRILFFTTNERKVNPLAMFLVVRFCMVAGCFVRTIVHLSVIALLFQLVYLKFHGCCVSLLFSGVSVFPSCCSLGEDSVASGISFFDPS